MLRSRSGRLAVGVLLAASLVSSPVAYARGGRGGGGGGFRGGGFGGGGMRGPVGGGGGFSHSPAVSAPRPVGGGGFGGGRPAGGPGPGMARPGGGGAPGIAGRPGGGGAPGIAGRPGGAGQPGIGGRPGIDTRPGGAGGQLGLGNRPGIDNRPGGGDIVNNRPVGGNTAINRGNVNISNRQNNFAGNRVDAGYGVRPPAYNNWRGPYGGYHQGWVNGYWHGYHNGTGWNWGSFALGTAVGVTGWGVGSALYNWGYASYANPYYGAAAQPIVIEQVVDGGVPQSVTVPASTYDYSQPLDTQAPPPSAAVTDPAVAKFDAARDAFKSGDYARALGLTDEALKTLPNDATLHEFRALVLFAVGQYDQAASPLYAVLAVGPGWDWTTLAGLYPSIDVYTKQLRALEQYVKQNPQASGPRFVLAYHYLTQGANDAALGQLKVVQKLAPGDTVSAQLIKLLSPPGETPEPAPSPPAATPLKEGTLAGKWQAAPNAQTSINLSVQDDGTFAWRANVNGKPQNITGNWSLAGGILTLAQGGQGSALVGKVNWQNENTFNFRALGAPGDDPGLTFAR